MDLLEQRAAGCAAERGYVFLLDGEQSEQRLSYRELGERARALSAVLANRCSPGERVLILLPPGREFICAFFACMYAGLVAVPVPLPQRKRGLPRLLAVIGDCRPRLAVSTCELLDKTSAAALLPSLEWLAVDDPVAPCAAAVLPPTHTHAAFLQYTSGSTGSPKGVVLTHHNLLANERMIARAFEHGPDSVIVGWLPPHHDMGLIGNILQPLFVGASCIQMAPQHFLLRPARWLEAISRYRGTTSGGPNFAYDLCVEKIPARERAALDLSSWRVAFNGAEPVRAATLERFAAAFASSGFQRKAFYPCYGLAEATLLVSGGQVSAEPVVVAFDRAGLGQGQGRSVPAAEAGAVALTGSGTAAHGLQVEIVEPESGRILADGAVGEVWIRGASVASGYWQAPEATREIFEARLSDGTGPFLRTGDLAFRRAGELFITGRSKDLIVVRGRNVYPQDLELSAEQSHALLRSGGACAFALESGQAEHVVLVLEVPDGAAGLAQVAGAARQAVAEQHELALDTVVLVRSGSLPRTTSGKLQRRNCRKQLAAGGLPVVWDSRTATEASAASPGVEQPLSALELQLSQLWCEVLGVVRVSRRAPFLELGGDSLRALQLAARVTEQFGTALPTSLLFEECTVASMAAWLAAQGAAPSSGAGGSAAPTVAAPLASGGSGPFALSATQERMWFLDQLAEGAPIHHLALALTLRGELRRDLLEQTIAQLVARHEALRTRFVLVEERPLQCVDVVGSPQLEQVQLDAGAALEEHLRRIVCRPFELTAGPPVRWTLVQHTPQEHLLVLTCHHLLADGWSLNLLLRELCEGYATLLAGRTQALAAPGARYAEYVAWQGAPERAARQERARGYWLSRLSGLESSELPTDRPRPAVQSYAGGRLEFLLEPALLQRLDSAGRRSGRTLFASLATALFALSYRCTGQTDLCLGTPLFDRGRSSFEQLVGCCVNTLALRLEVSGELTLAELGARVQSAVREGLEHGELPFERVLSALPTRRDTSRSPLFQLMLTVQPELGGLPAVPGLELAVRQLGTDTAQLDLAIDVARDGGAARVAWEYNRELFDADTVRAYWAQLCRLLEALSADPTRRVSSVELRDEAQRAPALAAEVAPAGDVLTRIACCVAERPDAPALSQGDVVWSLGEVWRRAEQLALRLRQAGVGPEARVALYLPSSPRMVVAALAVLRAGGAYVPLELQQPASRLEHVLSEADVRWIVSERALGAALPANAAQLLLLDEEGAAVAAEALPEPEPEQLAYVLFTSGSTGKPKGVLVSHGMLSATCQGWDELYRWGDVAPRVLGVSNPAFDVWSADWLRALCTGGCLVFAGPEVVLDPRALSQFIAAQRIDLVDLVPSLLRPLLEHWQQRAEGREEGRERDEEPPQTVRVFIVGSEAWSRAEYRALRRLLPASTRLLSCYGVTEASIDSAWFEAKTALQPEGEGSVPLGAALVGSTLRVLDRDGVELPAGIPGELAIGGSGVARGYAGQARLTAERFRPDPFGPFPGARLYLSGDRVRRARDGHLEFLGRRDQQLKLRGRRVEPAEIERQLLLHPGIAACAVALWSAAGREPLLVAYVVATAEPLPSTQLRAELRQALPEALLPGRILWLAALPLNANGKLDRARLPEPGAEDDATPTAAPLAGASELEQRIAAIWCEALGVERVGRHDNFFDLGGHSLLLTRVLGRLRADVRAGLTMITLFRHPTIAGLAEALSGSPAAPLAVAAPAAGEPQAAARRRELRERRRRGLEQDE